MIKIGNNSSNYLKKYNFFSLLKILKRVGHETSVGVLPNTNHYSWPFLWLEEGV